jgi:hypothetical protein
LLVLLDSCHQAVRAFTGKSTAEAWSRALGKQITYGGNDLDAWEKQSLQYMPDWLVFDFKHMYDYFQSIRSASRVVT